MKSSDCSHLLNRVREIYSQEQVADALGRDVRTIRRWESGGSMVPSIAADALRRMLETAVVQEEDEQYRVVQKPSFRFIDLFAGIGGTRQAFENSGGLCVFTSEWDRFACQTYRANFSDSHPILGDVTKVNAATIPDHEVLVAGFPCQPFSLAGVSKKNSLGRLHGFKDKTQGTLFFDVARILDVKRPDAFLLENVKHLQRHDQGRTLEVILATLRNELGYQVTAKVLNSASVVPQQRERIFLVGFREECGFDWSSVDLPSVEDGPLLGSILHGPAEEPESPYTRRSGRSTVVDPRYVLSDHLWDYLQRYAAKHREKGNGFGCSIFDRNQVARTLSARYHKDGSEILIARRGGNPRRLTPRECARLMGFPDSFRIPVSDTQAYRQFGNSVVVPVVTAVARAIAACLAGKPLPTRPDGSQMIFDHLREEFDAANRPASVRRPVRYSKKTPRKTTAKT